MAGSRLPGVIVQERDQRLFQALSLLRFLDRSDLMAIGPFTSVTRANARARQLVQAGLLEALPVGTIGGGRQLLYALSRKGAALVGAPYRPLRREDVPALSGDPFLQHQLALNKFYVAVAHRPIPAQGVRLCRWLSFSQPIAANSALIPDGYFELAIPAGVLACFLEIDMGTESPKVWREKIRQYLGLAVSGEFEREFQQRRFRVLVVTTTEKRLHKISSLVRRSTDKVFWLSTFDKVNREGLWSKVWHRPTGDEPASLV